MPLLQHSTPFVGGQIALNERFYLFNGSIFLDVNANRGSARCKGEMRARV
ncbi:hypothetical protein NMC30_23420 [Agrobacterium tumefaciens]|nr:hypothetical protein [Agrobacterium tumefaciens]MCW8060190.1 hypothetical protein [Agrobacterium tumefaciens]